LHSAESQIKLVLKNCPFKGVCGLQTVPLIENLSLAGHHEDENFKELIKAQGAPVVLISLQ
jgi:hypothetical protein